jgi:hypothetical protein
VTELASELLHMELSNCDPAAFAQTRVPQLAAVTAVTGVTWWEAIVPGRNELPVDISDGTVLGLATSDTILEPDALAPGPDTVAQHTFRRYPRPTQGRSSGRPVTGLLVVWITPKDPEDAQSVRDWGDFIHIHHIAEAAMPGFGRITAYEHAAHGEPRYLHLYELDGDDPEASFQAMATLMADFLGGRRTPQFRQWADWDAAGARIVLCNTFRLCGTTSALA